MSTGVGGGDNQSMQGGGAATVKGLFPSVFNLATNAEITANATCGQHNNEPEIYCKLVEHVYVRAPQCGVSYYLLSPPLLPSFTIEY